jgi:hypothetical protein
MVRADGTEFVSIHSSKFISNFGGAIYVSSGNASIVATTIQDHRSLLGDLVSEASYIG